MLPGDRKFNAKWRLYYDEYFDRYDHSRSGLEVVNRKTLKYPLHIAEKDYFLALVLRIIANSTLKDALVFKGGTALHHVILSNIVFRRSRFSANGKPIALEEVRNIFNGISYLSIKKDYLSGATVKIEKLQYAGAAGSAQFALKWKIDFFAKMCFYRPKL